MQSLEFVLKPSKLLAFYLHGLFILSLLFPWFLELPLLYCLILSSMLCFYWIKSLAITGIIKNKKAVYKLWQQGSRFGYETYDGIKRIGILMGDSYKSALFLIIRIKSKHKVRSILIPKDALCPEEYQLLCTRMLFFNEKYS